MRKFYNNEVAVTMGGGYDRRNYFPPLKNSFPFLKNLKILFSITLVLSLFFTSCNLLSDDDSGTLSINLPPIVSNSRSIAGERIEFLKNATASYRVTVNGMTREGTGVNYEFTLPVGTMANITVECLNSNGEVIVRAFKEHKVVGGDNVVSISLKNDGNEIINGGVTYSYGDAAAGGAVTGFPSSVKVGVGEKFTVTGDANSITWDHGTFNGWITNVVLKGDADSGTGDVAAGDTVPAGTYIMPSQNVILTAQWQKKQYIITYNTNSPAGANVSSVANLSMTDALTQVTLATAPTVTNNPVPDGSGQKNYMFLHWRDTSDGTTYSAGTQITLTKSMTLEAVWSDETVYTVTFVSPPKSVSVQYDQQIPSSPQTVEVGNSLSWTNPSALGWTFGGWEVSDAGDSSVTELPESATSYTPKGNTTLTAKLTAKSYTVNYDVRNGEGVAPSPAPKTIVSWDSSGGNFTPNNGANFSRPGYRFTGWEFSDGTNAGSGSAAVGGRKFMEMADGNNSVTVYAVWERVYSITYEWGSGVTVTSGNPPTAQSNITSGQSATVEIPTVQADYTFLGWSESTEATSATYKTGSNTIASVTKDYTLYGVWARTVLYNNGTLVINELKKDSKTGVTVTKTYDAMQDDGSNYMFSMDIPPSTYSIWYNDASSITSVEIGSNISPTSTALWFLGLTNCVSMDLSKLDTSRVTSMEGMFRSCSKLTALDVSKFNTSSVTTMEGMFRDCSQLTALDVSKFDTSRVTSMSYMFGSCSQLTALDVSNFVTSNVTNMSSMFDSCSKLTALDVSNFVTSNVTNMSSMFISCKFTTLDLQNFDTSNVTDMSYMFSACSSFTSLNVSRFNTSRVTGMYAMFNNCVGLTSLDLSSFNTSKVTDMRNMFYNCVKLTTIYASDTFTTDAVAANNDTDMFARSSLLVGGQNTNHDENNVGKTYARIDNPPSAPGYFTEKP